MSGIYTSNDAGVTLTTEDNHVGILEAEKLKHKKWGVLWHVHTKFHQNPSTDSRVTDLLVECLIQQQEDQTNSKDNIPPIEEATERKPYGLRIF
jgi:hypothetical protein